MKKKNKKSKQNKKIKSAIIKKSKGTSSESLIKAAIKSNKLIF